MIQDSAVYIGIFLLVFVMGVGWSRTAAPNWYRLHKKNIFVMGGGFCVIAAGFFILTSAMHIRPLDWLFR